MPNSSKLFNALAFCLLLLSSTNQSIASSLNLPGVPTEELLKHALFADNLAKNPILVEMTAKTSSSMKGDLLEVIQKNTSWPVSPELQNSVLQHPMTLLFKEQIENDNYQISEIMLTDKLGGLIAAYPLPTDYWQGDEDKFIMPLMIKDKHITDVAWDTSAQSYQYFICIPLSNDNQLLGVLIVGVDVTDKIVSNMKK